MIRIEKGEYECPKCKKFTVVGRTKKAEEAMMCCGVEMVKLGKKKFTEPPEPKAEAAAKTKKTKAKAKRKSSRASTKKVAAAPVAEFPLTPGEYRCPTCGATKDLGLRDARDKHLRCDFCFVKMEPV